MMRPAIALFLMGSATCADPSCDWLLGMPISDVVIVGEVHDNPLHHQVQACVVTSVQPAAVVFEMLDETEAQLARGAFASTDELAAAVDWANSGWPDFAIYQPIFQAIGSYGWTIYPPFPEDVGADSLPVPTSTQINGAEVTSAIASAAISEGAANVFGPDAARFGLARPPLADQQTAREALQMAAHCDALPPEMLPGFVEAQRLRDARLAQMIVQAHAETGGPVIVITGNGHARTDWGVPAVLALAAPDLTVFSVGQVEGQAPADAPYDLVLTSPVIERPDPCAAFDQG